jgi:hypothetical protein
MPFGSSYVDNRRSGSLYDADGNVLLDHGSNRTHIYDAASRQVQTREQSDSSSWGLGLGASQSTSSSSSPSPSPSASPSPAVGEPDAPQPNAPIDGYYTTTTLTIAESYDGDGRSLKRVQTKVQSRPFYPEVIHEIVDYYLRSTVLGGQVITELTSAGQKQKTNVYIGSEVAAEQVPNGESQFLTWKYSNPVTGTSAEQTSFVAKKEYDPFGLELGDSDPYLQSEFPDYPALPGGSFYGEGGNPFDGSSGCQWNGMPVPCHVLGFIARTHPDIQFEIHGRNAPPGFGMGLGGRWIDTRGNKPNTQPPDKTAPDGTYIVGLNGWIPTGHWELVHFFFTDPQNSAQQKTSDLLNFKVPSKGRIEANYWKRFGKRLYACIDIVFGAGTKDAELAKKELAIGLAYLDFSYNSKQLGAMGVTGLDQHTPAEAEALNDPWRGPAGTIYKASNPASPLYESITHEEGNILASKVTLGLYGKQDWAKYGDPNGIGKSKDPNQRDYDTGANLQRCVHGAKSIGW